MKILLANPRGFCAGVGRAIDIVESVLKRFGAPIYVRHEVVHNQFVVSGLREQGAIFVEELTQVPDDAIVIFSAHGTPAAVRAEAERRGLKIFDATCPLVTKVHSEVVQLDRAGNEIVLIGHRGHPEVIGTMGQNKAGSKGAIPVHLVETEEDAERLEARTPDKLAFVTQTTLSVDDTRRIVQALKRRFPRIKAPRKDDICYATQNRQDAVRELAEASDVVLIVGSANSSNSTRLQEVAVKCGKAAYLVDGPGAIKPKWLRGRDVVGISAGASAPEALVRAVVEEVKKHAGDCRVFENEGVRESVVFSMPKGLIEDGAPLSGNRAAALTGGD